MVRKDDSRFWCRVTAAPLAGGEASQRVVALYEDITARKEAEQALRSANEEMDAIFDSASSGIALIRERVVLRCNRRLEEIFGWGPGELVGQSTRVWYVSDESFEGSGQRAYAALTQTQQPRARDADGAARRLAVLVPAGRPADRPRRTGEGQRVDAGRRDRPSTRRPTRCARRSRSPRTPRRRSRCSSPT